MPEGNFNPICSQLSNHKGYMQIYKLVYT